MTCAKFESVIPFVLHSPANQMFIIVVFAFQTQRAGSIRENGLAFVKF